MPSFLPAAPKQSKPKLLDQVRRLMRLRHYRLRNEEAYVSWIRRYILFNGKRHPRELDEKHVSQFLTDLAINGRVAAFFFQAEDGIRYLTVTGVQTCALPI